MNHDKVLYSKDAAREAKPDYKWISDCLKSEGYILYPVWFTIYERLIDEIENAFYLIS